MKIAKTTKILIAATLFLFTHITIATPAETLLTIKQQWAVCQYAIDSEDEQISCLQENVIINKKALDATSDDNELKLWLAINTSTLAGIMGGLDALPLVKESKTLLEEVIKNDLTGLNGAAYTTLGTIYYRVPGWPIAFGDDEKAETMLKKALIINPQGVSPNYFYADFLLQNGQKEKAKQYFKKAQLAPPRPDRPLADKGRQQAISDKLNRL